VIERCEEDGLLRRGRLQRRPGPGHAPCAQLGQHPGIAAERAVHPFPALHLYLDEVTVGQHRRKYLLRCPIRFAAPVKRISRAGEARQAVEAHFLADQEAVRLGFVAFADEMRRRDRFGEGVHALEVLAVVRHHFA
jgi:hypothetical protein